MGGRGSQRGGAEGGQRPALRLALGSLLALVIANAAVGATGPIDASETLLQISFILLALFMVAVPLDTLRLAAALRGGDSVREVAAGQTGTRDL